MLKLSLNSRPNSPKQIINKKIKAKYIQHLHLPTTVTTENRAL